MAQTVTNKATASSKQEIQKQKKRQVKRVSKLQLEVGQAQGKTGKTA